MIWACLSASRFLRTFIIVSMEQVSLDQARRTLGEIVDRARLTGQATLITRQGKPAAVVISLAKWAEVQEP